MNPPDKPKPKWTQSCYFDAFIQSTKDEVACAKFGKMVPVATCRRGCPYYKPVPGSA
jgi:hypothetical protein